MSTQPRWRACACEDFNRSELLRRAAATAGRGLPCTDAGMPAPAGTGLSRRGFVLASAGLVLSVYGAGRLLDPGAFSEGIAQASAAPSEPVLVSVYLQGGIDSMSVLYPAADPLYAELRPALALPADAGAAFAEDPRLHWHPLAAPLAALHGEGKVSVLPAVGYSHPDQSHFTSRHFWEVGATRAELLTGWLGRYLDLVGSPSNPLQGLCLDETLQPSLATARMPVAAIDSPSSYAFYARGVWGPSEALMYDYFDVLGRLGAHLGDRALTQSASAASMSSALRRQLAPLSESSEDASSKELPAGYPSSSSRFPARMAAVAKLLAGGLPLRCVSVSTDWCSTRTMTKRRRCRRGSARRRRRCTPFSATSRRVAWRSVCSRSCGRSSGGALRRTPPAAPTTGRPAARSSSGRAPPAR